MRLVGGVMQRWMKAGLGAAALVAAVVFAVERVFVVAGADEPPRAPEIIAHRGASEDAPENTLAAFELAWKQGADAVEVDARLSRDGQIVLMHDATTRRTTGHEARVANLTLAQLKALDAGSWKGREWAGERIPTLAEAAATVPEGGRLFVDLKVGREIVSELVRVLGDSGLEPAQVAVIGTSLPTLEAVKRALPGAGVYWIVSTRQHPETGGWLPSLENRIRRAQQAGLDGLNFRMAAAIDRPWVERTHAAGLKLLVWTVNTPDEARQARDAGVDGITTDRPGWLRELLHAE